MAESAGARLRASCLGSVRCDQSFRVTKEMPELVFSARDRRSKPEKVTTLATAGFFISAAVASLVTSRGARDGGGGRQHRDHEDVALVLGRHQAARDALEQDEHRAQHEDEAEQAQHRAAQQEAHAAGVARRQPGEGTVEPGERPPRRAVREASAAAPPAPASGSAPRRPRSPPKPRW